MFETIISLLPSVGLPTIAIVIIGGLLLSIKKIGEENSNAIKDLKSDVATNSEATKILLRNKIKKSIEEYKDSHQRPPRHVIEEINKDYEVYEKLAGENGYIDALMKWLNEQ